MKKSKSLPKTDPAARNMLLRAFIAYSQATGWYSDINIGWLKSQLAHPFMDWAKTCLWYTTRGDFFRVCEDGSFADENDNAVDFDSTIEVKVFSQALPPRWAQIFDDYMLVNVVKAMELSFEHLSNYSKPKLVSDYAWNNVKNYWYWYESNVPGLRKMIRSMCVKGCDYESVRFNKIQNILNSSFSMKDCSFHRDTKEKLEVLFGPVPEKVSNEKNIKVINDVTFIAIGTRKRIDYGEKEGERIRVQVPGLQITLWSPK